MEEQENLPDLKQHAAKNGAILGAISIIISLLVYVVDATIYADWWYGLLLLVISLGYISYSGIQFRNEIGGFLSFGKAYVHGFIAFCTAGLIGILFQILLFQVIDPDLVNILIDASVENTAAMMEKFGADPDSMEEALDKVREDMPDRFSAVGQLKGYGIALIFYAIFSLISGAIAKKKDPSEDF